VRLLNPLSPDCCDSVVLYRLAYISSVMLNVISSNAGPLGTKSKLKRLSRQSWMKVDAKPPVIRPALNARCRHQELHGPAFGRGLEGS
jgi:hypothetical protein